MREGLETLELRVSQGQQGCQVCPACQGRTEPLDRRVSRDLQVSEGQRGHLELAPRVKRVTKAKEE